MNSRQIGGVVLGERGGLNEPNELPLDPPLPSTMLVYRHIPSLNEWTLRRNIAAGL